MGRVRPTVAGGVAVVAGPLALAVAGGAVAVADGPGGATTYPGRSTALMALTVAAGLALVAAGIAGSFGLQHRSAGWLAVLAGLTWFSPVWVAYRGEPLLVPTIAMVLVGFTFAFVAHLVLAYPGGRVTPLPHRVFVLILYVEAFLAAIGLALVRDPFFDPACYSNCALNVFLVRSLPTVARAIQSADRWFVAAAAVSLIGMCFWRLASASRAARRTLAPVVLPGVLFAAATVARAVDLQHVGVENPFNDVLLTIFVVEAIALLLLAVGLSAAVWRTLSERRAVARIVTGLGEAPEPGSVQAALAAVLSDPGLRIAYPLTGEGRYIDARGRHVDGPVPGDGRVITRLVRADRTIAIVSQSAGTRELEQRLGPALLLALENERLQAELLAELEELRASRLRIVETTETERRRLERDLHDGAQQRLLALSYDVRRVRAAAESVADERTGTLLARAIDQTQTALEGLRRVAHGIYPAILAEAGLAAALATFADTAPLPVQLKGIEDRRYPGPVESAVYFSVVETVADAVDRGAGRVTVRASHEEGRLDLEVEDDGSERTSPMVSIIDRIGAAGGEVVAEPRRIRVSIPCE